MIGKLLLLMFFELEVRFNILENVTEFVICFRVLLDYRLYLKFYALIELAKVFTKDFLLLCIFRSI